MSLTVVSSLSQRSLLFLLISIGLITLPHVFHIPTPLFVFFVLVLSWRFAGIWHKNWLPNRLLLSLVTTIGLALLYSQHQGLFGRDAGTSLFTVALGLKLLEIHGRREIYLVVFLAFVVAASQFFYEQSMLMAAYILLVCTLLLATLIIENSSQSRIPATFKTALTIILQALPIALVLFVLFPRLEAPHWLWLEDNNRSKAGLSDTLEPGSISDLSLSDELVFRVRFAGSPPPPRQRYWRGPVYSVTDGIRWTAPASKNYKINQDNPIFSDQAYHYTVLMEPQKESWVFGLELPEQFDPSLRRNSLYQLISSKKPGDRVEYKITSYPVYNTGKLSKIELKDNLQLPEPTSEKIASLVKELQGYDAEPAIFIRNLLNYFRVENFHYTLKPPLMLVKPIETFLFDTRSGFCSHYATAFVYLMRVASIPARVVGGYQGGEFNKVGGFLEIRQADAHAWAEVWLEGKGWVRFDPTAAIAPERVERGVNIDLQIASGAVNFSPAIDSNTLLWLKRSRQLWNTLDYNWQHWVINYDTASQSRFLSDFGIRDWLTMAGWLIGSITVITLVLSWYLLSGKYNRNDKVLKAYQRFCRKIAKTGIQIRLGEGAKDFATRAAVNRPDLKAEIELITAIFIRLRFEAKSQAGDLDLLRKQVGRLRV